MCISILVLLMNHFISMTEIQHSDIVLRGCHGGDLSRVIWFLSHYPWSGQTNSLFQYKVNLYFYKHYILTMWEIYVEICPLFLFFSFFFGTSRFFLCQKGVTFKLAISSSKVTWFGSSCPFVSRSAPCFYLMGKIIYSGCSLHSFWKTSLQHGVFFCHVTWGCFEHP